MNHRHPNPRILDHPAPEHAWAAAERRRAQWAAVGEAGFILVVVPLLVFGALVILP